MKNILLMCVMWSLVACVKIQKKSELKEPTVAAPEQEVQTMIEARPEPVIFVLDEVLSQTQDLLIVADEVHLKSNARIYTNQYSLRIEAARIFINQGVFIQTFAEHQMVAPMEHNGIDGGVVHIKGNDIHGNLRVFMNGQSGGAGLGGWSALDGEPPNLILPQSACYPNSGKNSGVSGSFFLEVNQSQEFSISTAMQVAEGGQIGEVSKAYLWNIPDFATRFKKFNDWKACAIVPVIGKAGTPGQICLKLSQTDLAKCERY